MNSFLISFSSILFIVILLILAYIDARTFVLPNALTYTLIMLGLGTNFFLKNALVTSSESVIGALLGFFTLWFANYLYRWFKGKDGIGMGDAKLMAGIGSMLGYSSIYPCILIASVSGLIGGLIWLRKNKLNLSSAFPFGPYLCLGAIVLISFRLLGIPLSPILLSQ